MPLSFEPGEEGQVDWGEAKVVVNGALRAVQLFCIRLSFSKASFVYPYERATMEAFLDGHVRAFEFFGGVPRRLAYDNLRSAVTHVGRGRERQLNERFLLLRSFYLFDTRFCNVASGNEKGDVENLVKRSQRAYLTPVPHVTSIGGDLAQKLEADCRRDLLKVDGRQTLSRGQLLERERAAMLPLPAVAFAACRERSTHVGKQSLVRFDGNDYSVPVAHAHRPCVVRGFVDRVEVEVGHETVASHARSYGRGRFVLEPLHYLELLGRKPGSLDNARPFKRAASAGSGQRHEISAEGNRLVDEGFVCGGAIRSWGPCTPASRSCAGKAQRRSVLRPRVSPDQVKLICGEMIDASPSLDNVYAVSLEDVGVDPRQESDARWLQHRGVPGLLRTSVSPNSKDSAGF